MRPTGKIIWKPTIVPKSLTQAWERYGSYKVALAYLHSIQLSSRRRL